MHSLYFKNIKKKYIINEKHNVIKLKKNKKKQKKLNILLMKNIKCYKIKQKTKKNKKIKYIINEKHIMFKLKKKQQKIKYIINEKHKMLYTKYY